MSIIFTLQEDALDCVQALMQAGRTYSMSRTVKGEYEIVTAE